MLAEELSINRCAQPLAKDKANGDGGSGKQIKVEGIAKQNLVKRTMTVGDDGQKQTGDRQGDEDAQRILSKQVLNAATNYQADRDHLMTHDSVGKRKRNQRK